MQRIVVVQAQRKQLAEWKLAETQGRQATLATARTELGAYMEDANLAGPLAVLALKQARRLAERAAQLDAELDSQRAAVHAAERRHRLAERITDAVAAENRVVQERHSLEHLIESAIIREQQLGRDVV